MPKDSYASGLRSVLAELPVKKGCCLHAFSDGTALYADETDPALRAEAIRTYRTRAKCPSCIPNFVRAVFLARGTVTDPAKGHHLEFHFRTEEETHALSELLASQDFHGKITVRKGNYILYWKDSEAIADFLAWLGAKTAAFKYMNSCIEKELRNGINREVNCDTANIAKTLTASGRQIALIRALVERNALDALPEALRTTAVLRMENDSLSLTQLGEIHDPPISKSCVNHRLARICETAESVLHAASNN